MPWANKWDALPAICQSAPGGKYVGAELICLLSQSTVVAKSQKPYYTRTHTFLTLSRRFPSRFLVQAWLLASLIEANKLLVGQTLWPRRSHRKRLWERWFQWGVSLVSPEPWQYQKRSCFWGSWLSWTCSLFFLQPPSVEILKILAQPQENITCGLTFLCWVNACQSSLVGSASGKPG